MQRSRPVFLLAGAVAALGLTIGLSSAAPPGGKSKPPDVPLEIASIHWEYNATAQDLGVHVSLDGEDWKKLKITNPSGKTIFTVKGLGPYKQLGLTELFFEGAEPDLADFPLEDLLALFPEGTYTFSGKTVDGEDIGGTSEFSHAIPDGPVVSSTVGPGTAVQISWTAVSAPPPGFPDEPIHVVSYQVLVPETLDIIVPATVLSLTLPPEYSAELGPGDHPFEVLAIDANGNQTTSEGTFTLP